MDVWTAEMLLGYGRAGLPVVVVGEGPQNTLKYQRDAEAATKRLKEVWAELVALETTEVAESQTAVPQALEELGVRPSVRYLAGNGDGSVITYRRSVDTAHVYWIFNGADIAGQLTVQLEDEGAPFKIDLWSGQVSPIPAFSFVDGYTTLNITLASKTGAAIYVGPTNPFNAAALDTHLTDTTCGAFVKGNAIRLYSNTSCTATTSSGTVIALSPNSSIPAPVELSSWTLVVEDWSPAHPNTTGTLAAETIKTLLPAINLTLLAPWPEIPGLGDASGVGEYTTRADLGAGNGTDTSNLRAFLDLGEIEGSWELRINGRMIEGTDLFGSEPMDVTEYVSFAASNEIKVTVATTLWNKLIAVWPESFGDQTPQSVGLIGPVTISFADEIVLDH